MNNPDMRHPLSGSAAVAKRLKQGEVTPMEQENDEEYNSYSPRGGDFTQQRERRNNDCGQESQNDEDGGPDQIVDQNGNEPAPDAGDG